MNTDKKYCIICGKENNASDKFCRRCGEPLEQTENFVTEYIAEKAKEAIRENLKEKATDKFLDWLKKLLNSKAYGIILSLTILVSAGNIIAGATGATDNDDFILAGRDSSPVNEQIEINNDTPGLNGGTSFSVNTEDMYSLWDSDGFDIYAEGEYGAFTALYLTGNSSVVYAYDLQVVDSNGTVTLDLHISKDTDGTDSYAYPVSDMASLFEIIRSSGESSSAIIMQLGPGGNIVYFEEYFDGRLTYRTDYYENGNPQYLWMAGGDGMPATEQYFNEDGTPVE